MKAAKKSDWKTLALPGKRTTIRLNHFFTAEEMQRICRGVVPEQMEDKWFIYWKADSLYFHRSWTGVCVYVVRFNTQKDGWTMSAADVNRDAKQYSEVSDETDREMVSYLIDVLLLRQGAVFPSSEPSAEKSALMNWSQVGRAMLSQYAADENLDPQGLPPAVEMPHQGVSKVESMSTFVTDPSFEVRLRRAISVAWNVFARKVGGGLIPINKEASMQLQYAYILRQLLPLTLHHAGEHAELELETGVVTKKGTNNIDVLLRASSASGEVRIAIEMKCYRKIAFSGRSRGAHDIFMKDVYEDLYILEEYVALGHASRGVALVMNDLERFVNPKVKSGKCWAYDISHGHVFPGGKLSTPIGGKVIAVDLKQSYAFHWEKFGAIWFSEIEGAHRSSN